MCNTVQALRNYVTSFLWMENICICDTIYFFSSTDMASIRRGLLRPVLNIIGKPFVNGTRVPPLTQHYCPHVVVPPPYVRQYATKKSKGKYSTCIT